MEKIVAGPEARGALDLDDPLADNLRRFNVKSFSRVYKLVACAAVRAGYDLALYRVGRYLDLCIAFWTLDDHVILLLCWV